MKRTVLLLVLLSLGACARPALDPLPPNGTILAFGDSLTVGVGASVAESYPSVLAELCSCNVVHSGVSGEVTSEGRSRLPSAISLSDPDLLLLLEGGNDILRDVDPEITRQNLASMIEIAQAADIDVVLIGVPQKKLFSNTAPFYRELADQYDLVFADDLVASLLRRGQYKSDAIHFNEAGYRKLAEAIHALLDENSAL